MEVDPPVVRPHPEVSLTVFAEAVYGKMAQFARLPRGRAGGCDFPGGFIDQEQSVERAEQQVEGIEVGHRPDGFIDHRLSAGRNGGERLEQAVETAYRVACHRPQPSLIVGMKAGDRFAGRKYGDVFEVACGLKGRGIDQDALIAGSDIDLPFPVFGQGGEWVRRGRGRRKGVGCRKIAVERAGRKQ